MQMRRFSAVFMNCTHSNIILNSGFPLLQVSAQELMYRSLEMDKFLMCLTKLLMRERTRAVIYSNTTTKTLYNKTQPKTLACNLQAHVWIMTET